MEWILITIAIAVVALVGLLVLPYVVKAKINSALKKMDGYTGHVEGLSMNLFTGIVKIHNATINKSHSPQTAPMLFIPEMIISFRLKELIKKDLDLKVIINFPVVTLIDDAAVTSDVEEETAPADFSTKLKDTISAMPQFHIDAEIHDATIRYKKKNPSLDLDITHANVLMTDLSNHTAQTKGCRIEIKGMMEDGIMKVGTTVYPLAPTLTLDLNLELQSVNLVAFNSLIKSYGKVDINTGTLTLFAEVAVSNNSFNGYLKPIVTELDFVGVQDESDGLFSKLWERIVAGGVRFLLNKRNGQLATTIPINGRLDDPEINAIAAFGGLVRNAFFKALRPSFEDIARIRLPWSAPHAARSK